MTTPLHIYKVNVVTGSGENALIVSLNFTTQEAMRNQVTRVSQSYRGEPTEIVEKIMRDENYLDSTRKLFVEPTANKIKMVAPNKKPFAVIEHLTEISNSKQHRDAPTYLFYETTKGFHYRSIDGLCDQDPAMTFNENIPDTPDEKGVIGNAKKNLETMNEMEVVTSRDTIYNTSNGFYSSKLRVHDLYNKTVKDYDFSYLDNFDQDTHTAGDPHSYQNRKMLALEKTYRNIQTPDFLLRQQVQRNTFTRVRVIHIKVTTMRRHFREGCPELHNSREVSK